mmetsp:Transcript_57173/g.127633  ORF Transcript_57173/g.127633 Transcript_57173/m.127633 type:complete len:94 (+) Transcript_57173:1445-1726(+)
MLSPNPAGLACAGDWLMAKLGVNGFGVGVVWLAPVLLGSETGASINDLEVTGASMIDFAVTGASTNERAVIGASTIERISPWELLPVGGVCGS